MNGESKSTNERGSSSVGSLGLSWRYKRFLFIPGCSSRPGTQYFFLTVHYFISFVPLPNKLGRLPCWVACLFVCVSGFSRLQGPALSGLSDLILKNVSRSLNKLSVKRITIVINNFYIYFSNQVYWICHNDPASSFCSFHSKVSLLNTCKCSG